jgi:hypothetical protein
MKLFPMIHSLALRPGFTSDLDLRIFRDLFLAMPKMIYAKSSQVGLVVVINKDNFLKENCS